MAKTPTKEVTPAPAKTPSVLDSLVAQRAAIADETERVLFAIAGGEIIPSDVVESIKFLNRYDDLQWKRELGRVETVARLQQRALSHNDFESALDKLELLTDSTPGRVDEISDQLRALEQTKVQLERNLKDTINTVESAESARQQLRGLVPKSIRDKHRELVDSPEIKELRSEVSRLRGEMGRHKAEHELAHSDWNSQFSKKADQAAEYCRDHAPHLLRRNESRIGSQMFADYSVSQDAFRSWVASRSEAAKQAQRDLETAEIVLGDRMDEIDALLDFYVPRDPSAPK